MGNQICFGIASQQMLYEKGRVVLEALYINYILKWQNKTKHLWNTLLKAAHGLSQMSRNCHPTNPMEKKGEWCYKRYIFRNDGKWPFHRVWNKVIFPSCKRELVHLKQQNLTSNKIKHLWNFLQTGVHMVNQICFNIAIQQIL